MIAKDSKAMSPRCDPEMERIWTVPVVMNHSRTSGARKPCSPMVRLRYNPRLGGESDSAAARTRLRHPSIRIEKNGAAVPDSKSNTSTAPAPDTDPTASTPCVSKYAA